MPSTPEQTYLRAILATVARQTFPPTALFRLVAPQANSKRSVVAFNLFDGTRSNAEVADQSGIHHANLSKLVKRWIDLGIMIRVETDGQSRPVHVYPIPDGVGEGDES